MAYAPDPAFEKLYRAFTADADSIGTHLNSHMGDLSRNDPLLVVTGQDMVLFPGNGREPLSQSFRNSTRGFVELTAISHLGVALPYLVRLKELGYLGWDAHARRLLANAERVRAVNSETYWRETVAVKAWEGLEAKIADLVDYSCDVTIDFIGRGLRDPRCLTFPFLREQFLDPVNSADVPVPMNDMMAATFALVLLDAGYRIIGWLREQEPDWARLMVIISGRAGRPTAGLSWQSNSMCHTLWQASGQRLSPERLYIAPHAPGLVLSDFAGDSWRAIEAEYRKIWFSTRVTVEMGRAMYQDYPAFLPLIDASPVIDPDTKIVSELPKVRSAEDRRAIITLLRFVMEDPRQQLANASEQVVVDQLAANGNRPDRVVIPGFTNSTYPRRSHRR